MSKWEYAELIFDGLYFARPLPEGRVFLSFLWKSIIGQPSVFFGETLIRAYWSVKVIKQGFAHKYSDSSTAVNVIRNLEAKGDAPVYKTIDDSSIEAIEAKQLPFCPTPDFSWMDLP